MPKQQSNDGNGSESPKTSELSQFQKFTTRTVHRSELKGAPYNPRYIKASAKAKLKATLERVGLVQPIVWNERTGNIVGGHQRISQIDALEGKSDYSLTVAVLDVDDAREKELNILLNNENVTGEWDLEKLKKILDDEIEVINTGFDNADFMQMFGTASSQPKSEHQEDLSKQLADVKAAYEKLSASSRSKDDTDFYNVVVFGSYNERAEFLKEFGFSDNRYIDGRTLVQVFRDIRNVKQAELAGEGKKLGGSGVAKKKAKIAKEPR
jgi:hypothetical protein